MLLLKRGANDTQNDIIALLDTDGNVVVQYKYDAWGKCATVVLDEAASVIAELNPFRYRGYYYDAEIAKYYLQSRYYDAQTGRFVNGDEVELSLLSTSIMSHNVFAYCGNQVINQKDIYGYWVTAVGISVGATVILGVSASLAIIFDGKGNFGLLVCLYLAVFGYGIGHSVFGGYFWKYQDVFAYKNAKMNAHSIGFCIGVDIVHDYPNYSKNLKARLVGFQITAGAKAVTLTYTPNSIVSFYLPMNKWFYNAWNSFKTFLRTLKIKFLIRRNA